MNSVPKRVWVGVPPVGRKSNSDSAEILPQKAENQSAKNMIRPKKYISLLAFYYYLIYGWVQKAVKRKLVDNAKQM